MPAIITRKTRSLIIYDVWTGVCGVGARSGTRKNEERKRRKKSADKYVVKTSAGLITYETNYRVITTRLSQSGGEIVCSLKFRNLNFKGYRRIRLYSLDIYT